MDTVEVLIITPCVGGVDLGGTGERRKQCASATTTTHRLDLSQESVERGRERCAEMQRGGGVSISLPPSQVRPHKGWVEAVSWLE